MVIKGDFIFYKDKDLENDVKLSVYAFDSLAKIAFHFCYEGNNYNEELMMWKFFDTLYTDKTYSEFTFDENQLGDSWRRIDIPLADKFSTNFQNRRVSSVFAATCRYVFAHAKRQDDEDIALGNKKYSKTFEFVTTDSNGNVVGSFTKVDGLVSKLDIKTKYFELHLSEIEGDEEVAVNDFLCPNGNKMFAPLKLKDKYNNVLSKTPIKNISFKYSEALLGFPFVIHEHTDQGTVVGMYASMEEVIDAHPEKNFAWIKERKYRIVTDNDLEEVLQGYYDYDGIIAIDTETSGLDINFKSRIGQGDCLVGICLSKEEGTGDFIPINMKHFPNVCEGNDWFFMNRYMKNFLETHKFVTHNLAFDWKVFYIYGINLNAVFDTMIAFNSTERYKHINFEVGLKELTKNIFDRDMIELEDFVYGVKWENSGVRFWDLTYEQCRQYAPTDADSTLCLYNYVKDTRLVERFEAQSIVDIELKYAKVTGYSEFWGYHVAIDELPALEEEIQNGIKNTKAKLIEIAGEDFNPDSPKQLGHIMYEKLKMPVMHGTKSTDKTTLKELSEIENLEHSDFINYLIEYRKYAGIYKNFLKKKDVYISEDGYIFPHVFSFGTDTGRCSIKNPNYQSYNDVVKKRIVPRGGFKMFDCDFSQIEYRVLCSIANEENLKKAFADPDMDYHTHQAARMFDVPYGAVTGTMRKQAKGINFGLPYGMGDRSLGLRIFGQATPENTKKAQALRRKYFDGQENIEKWFQVTRDNAVANGYSRTLFGRSRYYFREYFSEDKIRRQAGNHVIQGCEKGDTLIQTLEYGVVQIQDIVGCHVHIWDGLNWTEGDIVSSGKKQKCVVHFSGGSTMTCSPIHKFLVRSYRGMDRFVECQKLLTRENTKNAHRVVVSQEYVPSSYKYVSDRSHKEWYGTSHNANNVFLDMIEDSFTRGRVLGRLASDGNVGVYGGHNQVRQIVAEHEFDVYDYLVEAMTPLNCVATIADVRQDRNECLAYVDVCSKTLVNEILDLDIRHHIDKRIFADTEMLRGFISGLFDGDGGISGKTITLVQGTQDNFQTLIDDVQKALLFFGIRSHARKYDDRYALAIKTNDNERFLDLIGFINKDKQEKGRTLTCIEDEHIFGKCLRVESVEITDEFIDMYDVANTERGYYVANGVVTHNTAADIYKIACNRLFDGIVAKGWLDKVLINAFIHDEILGEVSEEINPFEFVELWRSAFEVPVENFCKLYAGFGIGHSWYEAKKQDLTPGFINEIIESPLRNTWNGTLSDFIDWVYKNRYDYELRRVIDYLNDEKSQGEIIKPLIETYLMDKLNDCPEDIILETLGDIDKYKVLDKNGKPNGYKFKLNEAVDVFCVWMNKTRGEGTLNRANINVISAADAIIEKPKVEHVFDFESTNISNWDFVLEMTRNMGFYLDYENKKAYMNLALMQLPNVSNDFISKFCTTLDDDELDGNMLPQVILVDTVAVNTKYDTKFYIKSSMFMSLQPYMNTLIASTRR